MKPSTKNVLIQVLIFGGLFLPAVWLGQRYALGLLGFYAVMLGVILLGKTVVRLIVRFDAHLRRVYGPKRPSDPPRQHESFDDAV